MRTRGEYNFHVILRNVEYMIYADWLEKRQNIREEKQTKKTYKQTVRSSSAGRNLSPKHTELSV